MLKHVNQKRNSDSFQIQNSTSTKVQHVSSATCRPLTRSVGSGSDSAPFPNCVRREINTSVSELCNRKAAVLTSVNHSHTLTKALLLHNSDAFSPNSPPPVMQPWNLGGAIFFCTTFFWQSEPLGPTQAIIIIGNWGFSECAKAQLYAHTKVQLKTHP